ncbi:MAG: hypothetical protein MPI95_05175 [Nitrosopumilus sp.]|nr:hypothetical protein [Nitrosopumilus sp.]CAI9832712.1 conserved hypothetical protein [Nitrosopumilaceae archaeon]MDA7940698.1 hypothetical protein [Nitrosopumilus sp.]MDA7942906.1 hypothetical protein [Nitrosopumilus sp.]MDA7944683.1 hypothetical protein [Nitrosopumilus sp.]
MGGACAVCGGSGVIELLGAGCTFCNGTGEPSGSAESYARSHVCQCILYDRRRCPLCGKECHHDTSGRPSILLSAR